MNKSLEMLINKRIRDSVKRITIIIILLISIALPLIISIAIISILLL